MREIMAAGMLEALGVYTSKAFSLIETEIVKWTGVVERAKLPKI